MWSRQGLCFTPPACYPGRKMAVCLEVRQDCPLGEGINGTEDAWHYGPWGLPAQLGPHPEASGATVWQSQDAEVFGGNSHEPLCGSCV